MKVVIAGAGIGGLTAALFLRRAGLDVRVFESTPEILPLGVGINVLPHATRELTRLGLGPELAQQGIPTSALIYFNRFGQRIWSEPRGLNAGYRWPQYSIHRGRLQGLLLEAAQKLLGASNIVPGHHLTAFEQRGEEVVATFSDKLTGRELARESADLLVAADGIHSCVRRHFYPDEGPPKFSGRILWRALTEAAPFLDGRTMVMLGHGDQKFIAYPICPKAAERGRSLVNWVAEINVGGNTPGKRDWNRKVDRAIFAPAFTSWQFDWLDAPSLIAGASEVFEFPMVDRDPVERWVFGRVALLGDAAHPMYPVGSNGASQAILDAAALAESLASSPRLEDALRLYEEKRLPPTATVVQSNRKGGPEGVMQIVHERAPNGFSNLEEVISQQELEEIAARYKQVAGFDKEALNRKD